MGTRKMSIQEGLNELKRLKERIEKLRRSRETFGAVIIGNKIVRGYESNDAFSKKVQSNFDSIKGLLERRDLIKKAIIKKNAEVEVTIGKDVMTLAEAIYTKTAIEDKEYLLNQLTTQYNQLMKDHENAEYAYQNKLDAHVESIVGKEQKDKMKANEEVIKFFKEENEPKFIDPIKLNETIEKMSNEIGEFKSQVDLALTRANIINDIEFEDPSYAAPEAE